MRGPKLHSNYKFLRAVSGSGVSRYSLKVKKRSEGLRTKKRELGKESRRNIF